MYCKVKQLRRNGRRLTDREISALPGVIGDISVCQVAGVLQATLSAIDDGALLRPLIPILFDFRLVGMGHARMLLNGFERQGNQDDVDAPLLKQEWAIEFTSEQPKEVRERGHKHA